MFYNFVLFAILNVTPFSNFSAQTLFEAPQPPVALVMLLEEGDDKKTDSDPAPKKAEPPKGEEVKQAGGDESPDAKTDQNGEQAELKKGEEDKQGKRDPEPPWKNMLLMMGVAFTFFYFIILRPQQKERAKQKDKLESLKKNDRVVTIGGIIGTIANFSDDGNEVTLKLDDNARVKILRSSVRGLYSPEDNNKDDSSK